MCSSSKMMSRGIFSTTSGIFSFGGAAPDPLLLARLFTSPPFSLALLHWVAPSDREHVCLGRNVYWEAAPEGDILRVRGTEELALVTPQGQAVAFCASIPHPLSLARRVVLPTAGALRAPPHP